MKPFRTNEKWGGGLKEKDQLDVLNVLKENNDRFSFSIEQLDAYNGPPMEIHLNSTKDVLDRPINLARKNGNLWGLNVRNYTN